jgi:isoleucyl-tRNA synthetase
MSEGWKDTLRLPRTEFPMRGNLPQREPEILALWESLRPYEAWQARDAEPWVLHDGPPYANGDIHIGHALNKILKDAYVKYHALTGRRVPYVPGWDCHGLPIETAVSKAHGSKVRELDDTAFRQACREYARKYVDIQRADFMRLGVLADWQHPYLTMDYRYEAETLRGLADLVERGLVYRMHKPVHWCPNCRTALAEAEVEYEEHESPSIDVVFPLTAASRARLDLGDESAGLVIWTTTPWTLPANQAVAIKPDAEYALCRDRNGRRLILATARHSALAEPLGLGAVESTFGGDQLLGLDVERPYHDTPGRTIPADFIELDTGTGLVHIAPGHGHDDWLAGRAHGLAVESPVDAAGRLQGTPVAAGLKTVEANPVIIEDLQSRDRLLRVRKLQHPYPHCWRCHGALLFRATDQWFINVSTSGLRERALQAISETQWLPKWGETRIRSMVEGRPDWCISRQRRWGVPIAVPFCEACSAPLLDAGVMRGVADRFAAEGADVWFREPVEAFLPAGTTCRECGGSQFRRETDILDVWFDSGISWAAVCGARDELTVPADLYLEGSDQHRGWFQSSLLLSAGIREQPPFRSVLTHGFVVDGQGRKMSKSLGNVVRPQDIIKKSGADILRLWVASEQVDDDVRISDEIMTRVVDAYRRVRNTFRYLLSVLDDFDPSVHRVADADLQPIDAHVVARLREVDAEIRRAYEGRQLHLVFQRLVQFCAVDVSALFVDIARDRLYCSGADSAERRSAQTTAWLTATTLIPLAAPVLSFTAEEAWQHMPGMAGRSVLTEILPATQAAPSQAADLDWPALYRVRDAVLQQLEGERKAGRIGSGLDAQVVLGADGALADLLAQAEPLLAEWFIVSQVEIDPAHTGLTATALPGLLAAVAPASGNKCGRCWRVLPDVGKLGEPELCRRCHEVVQEVRG